SATAVERQVPAESPPDGAERIGSIVGSTVSECHRRRLINDLYGLQLTIDLLRAFPILCVLLRNATPLVTDAGKFLWKPESTRNQIRNPSSYPCASVIRRWTLPTSPAS